ncbi:MAG: WD40 repeat domain-containing protein [Moorea sp. SIO2B7]|nr:WD40 repeat domain-containing protein [Moorena sp. SIO2B7]
MQTSSHTSFALTIIEQEIFRGNYEEIQEIMANDPVEINIPPEDGQILPPQFLNLADKLHKNYLYWKHLRDTQTTTKATFYLYTKEGIDQAAKKVAEAGTPIDPDIFLILEAQIALATINSLIISAETYLKEGYLQDAKESVDTALSTLYEFIKTREKLEPSLKKAVAGIRQDIANNPEASQYASYLMKQIEKLKDSPLIREEKFYVITKQLKKLGETLILLIPANPNTPLSQPKDEKAIDHLMTRLLFTMAQEDAYVTTITHEKSVRDLTYSPDGTYLATASFDKTAKLVEVATGREITTITHRDLVYAVKFSPDGNYLATISKDKTAKLVAVTTGREVTTISHENQIYALTFSPDGTYLATASRDKTAKLVAVATGTEVTWINHRDSVRAVTFSPDGTYLATASNDYTAKLVAVATGTEVTRITHKNQVRAVKFSPDGTYLATASCDKTAKLMAVATGTEVTTIIHKDWVSDVNFSPDGTYLATKSNDYTIKLVAVATGRRVTTIIHENQVTAVAFSPDGTYLATASWDKTAKLVEVATGTEVTRITHEDQVYAVAFSPDGTYLATRSKDKTAKLVKVATGIEVTRIIHRDWVSDINFSPDGNYLAIASSDKTAKLVAVATGIEVTRITHGDVVWAVIFSPDGNYLATRSSDNTAKMINFGKFYQGINEERKPSATPQPKVFSLVQIDKSEAFFLTWLRQESNSYSFYEYMLRQAERAQEGLAVSYYSSVLDTNLLLESLGFLLLNAEKHYQNVYPTLIDVGEKEICFIAMQDMKQSISAGLSSLYEFLCQRMELDHEDYNQAIERFKQEVEEKIDNSELLLNIYHKIQSILQFEGIQELGELQTIKDMLEEMQNICQQLLPEYISLQNPETSVISVKQNLDKKKIINAIQEINFEDDNLLLLLSNLDSLGLLNYQLAKALINKRRKTHYISTFSELNTDITNKEELLYLLDSAPEKRWWRQ